MPHPFARTLRSVASEQGHWHPAAWLVVALLAGWVGWFLLAPVSVYEVSGSGRIEVDEAAHPVAAEVPGRVSHNRLALGHRVAADEVLVVLDDEAERLAAAEKRSRLASLDGRKAALRGQMETERLGLEARRAARPLAVAEAKAGLAEAEARAQFAATQVERNAKLRGKGAASEVEYQEALADADVARARVAVLAATLARLEQDRRVQEGDQEARLAQLRAEVVGLEGDRATEEAALKRLEHSLARRTIRAPVAGRVAEVCDLRRGAVVAEGARVVTIVPDGTRRVVAFFPARAVGRLCPGQPARLRLEGFSWAQYGTVPSRVVAVGSEAVPGGVRVELALEDGGAFPVPLEHGAPVRAEVAVETTSPANLVLRAAGEWLGRAAR